MRKYNKLVNFVYAELQSPMHRTESESPDRPRLMLARFKVTGLVRAFITLRSSLPFLESELLKTDARPPNPNQQVLAVVEHHSITSSTAVDPLNPV